MHDRPSRQAPQTPDHITPDQQRSATELIALFAAGELSMDALRNLGSRVLRFDLDAAAWNLKGWNEARQLRPGTGVAAMALAVGAAFQRQRVRLGCRWLKDSEDGRWRLAQASVSEFSMRGAVHPCAPAQLRGPPYSPDEAPVPEKFLERLAAEVLTGRERQVLWLHLDGHGEREIAAQLGCVDRTVRRDLERIKAKGRTFYGGRNAEGGWSTTTMTHEGLRKITRSMTADEWADHCAGYPASQYRRRKERLAEVVPLVPRAAAVAQPLDEPEDIQAA